MKYLFGDSTPFPMTENFLETACAASETAVALLRADELRVEERRLLGEIEQRSLHENAHFEAFARGVDETYAKPVDELRAQMGMSARTLVAAMREEITRWREGAVAKALETAALANVLPTIARFFERHQLPGTEWSLAWGARLDGKGTAVAQVHARAPGDLDVSLDVAIPVGHAWARPARVSTIEKGAAIHLVKKRVLRKARVEAESLDSLFVTEIIDLPGECTMTLRRSSKNPSPGLRIVLLEGSHEVQVSRIAEDGTRVSEPEIMRGEDATVLRRLFARISVELRSLVAHRNKLRAAYFRDVAVHEFEQPAVIGKLIVDSVAPYIREIARRSNGKNELALKRTLGDGRREELFVSYPTVLAGVSDLAPQHRAFFDAYGLGDRPRLLLPPPRAPQPRAPLPSEEEMTVQRPIMRASA
jgi:hypothetical protein